MSRKTNRDHAKKKQRPMVEDQVIAEHLTSLLTPSITSQSNNKIGVVILTYFAVKNLLFINFSWFVQISYHQWAKINLFLSLQLKLEKIQDLFAKYLCDYYPDQ